MKDIASDNQTLAAPASVSIRGEAFVSRLTAQGRGAIAVVRVWGPRALEIADAVFRPVRGLRLAESRRGVLRLGHIGHGLGDEVVVVVLDEEPPAVEVQCHGGAAAVALVMETLQAAGASSRVAAPLARSVRDHPFAEHALADLARAPTLLTAEILLDQAHGALRNELVRISHSVGDKPNLALSDLDTLIHRAEIGLRLLDGWRVVIAGRPNVGKSRLFNALVGFDRAIVDPTPGTTRAVVSLRASFGGWPVALADTAGLRAAFDPIESIGIERSRREQRQADLIVLVLDRSQPLQAIDHELIATNAEAILVGNKSDLPPAWTDGEFRPRSTAIVMVSAASGNGLENLIAAIVHRLVPQRPPEGGAVPFRSDHIDQLHEIRASVLSGDRDAALRQLAQMLEGPKSQDRPEP
jgi:tRNA modification GTPase